MDGLRAGRVSSINYAAGTARIVYTDRDNAVTKELPFLCIEYSMPAVGDLVFAVHMANGVEMALILGRPWSAVNMPPEGYEGLYRKDFAREPGKAMLRYDDNEEQMRLVAPELTVEGATIPVVTDYRPSSVDEILRMLDDHEARLSAGGH